MLYNHANFYRFKETSGYWLVKRISVFLCFSLVSQRHTSGITVYHCTVTNIENTVRAAIVGYLLYLLNFVFLYICVFYFVQVADYILYLLSYVCLT